MLRFNSRWSDLYRFAFKISIHLMLRFNYLFLLQKLIEFPFQYILCCGSTRPSIISKWFQKNFNTSYVAVQLLPDNFFDMIIIEFQYILCCGSTLKGNKEIDIVYVFQYILCCGSTLLYELTKHANAEFQYILCCGSTM